jgi:hypothetical protein
MAKLRLNLVVIPRINLMGKLVVQFKLYLVIIFRMNLVVKSNGSIYTKPNFKFSVKHSDYI